jgi:alanine racemase
LTQRALPEVPREVPSRTWAEVNLGTIRHNVRTLKRRAGDARLMAVVKGDAYGHGAIPVAQAALEAGADSLAVVTVEEGAELRGAGISAPILVFTDLSRMPSPSPGRTACRSRPTPSRAPDASRRSPASKYT